MFNLLIASPEAVLFDGPVKSAFFPGSEGGFEILSNHAPMLALVKEGEVRIKDAEGQEKLIRVESSFFEVAGNKATLLAIV